MQKTDLKIKAKELVEKFIPHAKNWDCYHDVPLEENHAKHCALIAVENSIKELMWLNLLCTFDNIMKINFNHRISELQDIKTEIENL